MAYVDESSEYVYNLRIMDEIDLQILSLLQADARVGNAEISRRVGLAASAVHERIRKLEQRGVVRGYHARLDPEALGRGLLAFISVQVDDRLTEGTTGAQLALLPQVQEVHHIAGEDCFLVKLRVHDTDALSALLRDRMGAIPTIKSTRTTIVLHTTKETARLPLAQARAGRGERRNV